MAYFLFVYGYHSYEYFSMFQCLKKVARYIEEQNKTIFLPQGIMVVDPAERGLRVVSFVFYYSLPALLHYKTELLFYCYQMNLSW